MITTTKYICEYCGSEYDAEERALACEASHNEPEVIDNKEWMFGKKYPDKLTVRMEDGAECQYHYFREMRGPNNG